MPASFVEDEEGSAVDDIQQVTDQVTKAPSGLGAAIGGGGLGGVGAIGLQRRTSAALALHAHSKKFSSNSSTL